MEAMGINKITWFEKQLQYKTGADTLRLSLVGDKYRLTMGSFFALEHYASKNPTSCFVSTDSDALYFTDIEQGIHYRLQANGKTVLFKIMTRKIWFFDSVDAM